MKKKLIILILIIVIIIVTNLFFLFYLNKNSKKVEKKEIELSPEFQEWFSQYRERWNFTHPYIKCIFEKNCNGTFYLEVEIKPEENISMISDILKLYGNIENTQEEMIRVKVNDPYKVDKIISLSFVDKVNLILIESDYKLPISDNELHYCEEDDDCAVVSGCCNCGNGGVNTLINKKYADEWNSLRDVSCKGIGCLAILSRDFSCLGIAVKKCINNSCKFLNYSDAPCDTLFYSFCRNNIPKSLLDELSDFGQMSDGRVSCRKIIRLCEKNMSRLEIYKKCISEIDISKEYMKGNIKISFDPNASEEEINEFINNSELEVEIRLSDYYYVIDTPGGELTEKFISYLKSVPNIKNVVKTKNSNHVVPEFYGNLSIDKSKKLINNFKDFEIDIDSLRTFNDLPRLGIIKVLEGEELNWICKLREEKIVYNSELI